MELELEYAEGIAYVIGHGLDNTERNAIRNFTWAYSLAVRQYMWEHGQTASDETIASVICQWLNRDLGEFVHGKLDVSDAFVYEFIEPQWNSATQILTLTLKVTDKATL